MAASEWAGWSVKDRDVWISENVMGLEYEIRHFTTNASTDYEVLKHVRETWMFSKRKRFMNALHRVINERAGGQGIIAFEEAVLRYEPGDYSHAAYLAVRGEVGNV